HLRGDALTLADEAQQDVLGADVIVAQLPGLTQAELEDALRARGERDVAGPRTLPLPDDRLRLAAVALERDAEALEGLGGHALPLVDEPQQDVLGADVIVVEHPGLFLGQNDDAPYAVGKPLEHCSPSHFRQQGRHRAAPVSGTGRAVILCGTSSACGTRGVRGPGHPAETAVQALRSRRSHVLPRHFTRYSSGDHEAL